MSRHMMRGRQLSRDTEHRKAMRRNLVQSLFEHGKVRTTLPKAKEYYQDLKQRMGKFGRHPDELKIASGISVVVGESEQEVRERLESWQELIHPDVGVLVEGEVERVDPAIRLNKLHRLVRVGLAEWRQQIGHDLLDQFLLVAA